MKPDKKGNTIANHTENRICLCNVYWVHSPVAGVYDNWELTDQPTAK
jgi:hypothetical protein